MNTEHQINFIVSQITFNQRKRLLFIVPESAGDIFLSTSLLRSLSESYKDYDIYFACNISFFDILKGNKYIYKTIKYLPIMDNQIIMEGHSGWRGLFDISIMVTSATQRMINYLNNGKTNIALNLRY
jgi:hypothetical protein